MLTLIIDGQVYTPDPIGTASVLLAFDRVLQVGQIDADAVHAVDPNVRVIDAQGSIIAPGLIDPHTHLIGAGGEQGFASRMPEVTLGEIALAGVTTVVGLLGTDTTTRDLKCLHAKCCQLWDEGVTAYMYTGGFEIPPRTLEGSIIDDIVMIDKIIGAGEIALSDARWIDPELRELALVVKSTLLGGMLSGKAGVAHFHLGDGKKRLALLMQLLDEYDFPPECIYVTHITRSEALMRDAIALAERGAYVDMDTIEENIGESLRFYIDHGGRLDRLTLSSDAHTPQGTTDKLFAQVVSAVRDDGFALEDVLALVTRNTASVLKLPDKGHIAPGSDADIIVLDADTLALQHVFARGRHLVADGAMVEASQQESTLQEARR
jgi:beta-aspartyl-dipeptidase (metallo-type)